MKRFERARKGRACDAITDANLEEDIARLAAYFLNLYPLSKRDPSYFNLCLISNRDLLSVSVVLGIQCGRNEIEREL